MKVHIYKDAVKIGKAASMLFASRIIQKPDCAIGMATGMKAKG